MKRIGVVASGLAGLLILATAALASSGVTNGSFEASGPPKDDWWWHVWGPSTAINGWTVPAGGSVDLVAEGIRGWQASDGIHSVDLDGDIPGAIQQTVTTVPGTRYLVRFDLSGNPDPDTVFPPGWNAVKRVEVTTNGANARIYSYDIAAKGNTHADMKYETEAYHFVATGTTTTLRFRSLSVAGWWGPVIDNVSLLEFSKDACKKDGWQTLLDTDGNAFKNQGDCVSFFATGERNMGAGN